MDFTINTVKDLLNFAEENQFYDQLHAHLRFWFRGESDAGWDPKPSVYREDFPAAHEAERLHIEQHLTRDFINYSVGLLRGNESQAELYFLQQHYGMPTRLLDWTTNALAALFFAVSQDKNRDKDGALYHLDAYGFAESQAVTDKYTGVLSIHAPLLNDFLKPIFEWKKPEDFPDYVLPILPDFSNYRIRFQRGCFTFHVPNRIGISEMENHTLKKFIVPKERKDLIRNELYFLGIDEFQIYGDLENLSKRLKRAYRIC